MTDSNKHFHVRHGPFRPRWKPAFPDIASEYMDGPLKGADSIKMANVNKTFPKDASVQLVADAIAEAVNAQGAANPSAYLLIRSKMGATRS